MKPTDPYRSRTAPLTSKRCILYIYSTNIGTENFKHVVYSPFFFSLQNAVCFIILTCLVPVLFTFYILDVLKLKKNNNSVAKRLSTQVFVYSTLYSCQISLKLELSRQIFEKYSCIKFHENQSGVNRIVTCRRTDGQRQTARHDVTNGRFSQFYEHAKSFYILLIENKQRFLPYTAFSDCFIKRDGECSLRGADWVFHYGRLHFDLKRLITIYLFFHPRLMLIAL